MARGGFLDLFYWFSVDTTNQFLVVCDGNLPFASYLASKQHRRSLLTDTRTLKVAISLLYADSSAEYIICASFISSWEPPSSSNRTS